MAFLRYLEGAVLIIAAFAPIAAAAFAWRARLVPEWSGATARLAELVGGVSATVVLCELFGSIGLFRLYALVPALAALGLLGRWAATRQQDARGVGAGRPERVVRTPRAPSRWEKTVFIGSVGLVVADWGTRTVDAFHHGITTVDSLWYHMPFAARFVQQGSIVHLHYVDSEAVTVFFPANSELVHALGILFMGNDILSPAVNMGWLGVALIAGWCIGRPLGVNYLTTTGVAVLLATPGLIATQPGGAYDDVVGIALLLSSLALLTAAQLLRGNGRLVGQCAAALAAGLALGTKFTFIAPVAVLTIGFVLIAPRGRRLWSAFAWLIGVGITGFFWYVRNLVDVGNPLPSLNIKLGPLHVPSPANPTPSSTVGHFLLNGTAWKSYFLPGLRSSFGPAWWAVLLFSGAGLVAALLFGKRRIIQMLGAVGLASGAIYIVTPQYLTLLGAPVYFVDNVRYVDASLVFGLVLLPLVPLARSGGRSSLLLGGYGLTILATQLDGTIWPFGLRGDRFAPPIRGADSLLGIAVGLLIAGTAYVLIFGLGRRPRTARPLLVATLAAVVAAGFGLQQLYLRDRYQPVAGAYPFAAWGKTVTHTRIGVAGPLMQAQYALYGQNLSNFVQYIAEPAPHDGFLPIVSCVEWRRRVDSGGFRYLVVSTGFVTNRSSVFSIPFSYTVWTRSDPSATMVHRYVFATAFAGQTRYVGFRIFRLRGSLDAHSCDLTVNRRVVPTVT